MAKTTTSTPLDTPATLPLLGTEQIAFQAADGPGAVSARRFWATFRRERLAVIGLAIVVFWSAIALVGPLFFDDPTAPSATDFAQKYQGPLSHGHLLGTDDRGRDLLARTVYGARVSMIVGAVATLFSLLLGLLLGGLAGYRGRFTDGVIMRLADIFFAFPYILGAVAVVTVLENSKLADRGFVPVILSIALFSWAYFARLLRGQLLALRQLDYVTAARAAGAGGLRILGRHLIPNAMPIMIVYTALNIGTAVLAESALSFLGAGIQEPEASWGLMLSQAVDALGTDNWLMVVPGLALASVVFAFVVVGDGLRDALDPRLGRSHS